MQDENNRNTIIFVVCAFLILMVYQFAVIERELADIVQYRLARVSSPDEPEGDLQAQSRLTAHLLAGVMRYVAGAVMAGDRAAAGDAIVETRRQLAALLPKLAGG